MYNCNGPKELLFTTRPLKSSQLVVSIFQDNKERAINKYGDEQIVYIYLNIKKNKKKKEEEEKKKDRAWE
jgi:hypothetical protein